MSESRVILPNCMRTENERIRHRTTVKIPADIVSKDTGEFTVECVNAVRRAGYNILTVGIHVTSEQKANWITDVPKFHNELIEKQLEAVPVHFLDVVEVADHLLVKNPESPCPIGELDVHRYNAALGLLTQPGRFEVVLKHTNESTTDNVMLTTEHLTMVDLLYDKQVDTEVVELLFPRYATNGTELKFDGHFLQLFTLPKRIHGRPAHTVNIRMSLGVTEAKGRYAIMTNFGYLPEEDTERMEAKYQEMEAAINDTEDDAVRQRLKRKRSDFFITEWQLDQSLHKPGFTIYIKTVPVFTPVYALKLMVQYLLDFLKKFVRDDMSSLNIELTENSEYLCTILVSNPTIASILARRFCDTYFGKIQTQSNLKVVFCADRKNHPNDEKTPFQVLYRPTEPMAENALLEKIKQVISSNVSVVVGYKTTGELDEDKLNNIVSLRESFQAFENVLNALEIM